MLGTILNTATILIGGTFGAIVRTGIGEKYKQILFNGLGLCCLVLGVNAALPNMAKSEYPVLFILSIAIGGLIGTRLDLAGHIDRWNERMNQRQSATGGSRSSNQLQGLVTGCLLYCIGTFAIVGPVLAALSPSGGWAFDEPGNTHLYTNTTLDLVTSAVLAVCFSVSHEDNINSDNAIKPNAFFIARTYYFPKIPNNPLLLFCVSSE